MGRSGEVTCGAPASLGILRVYMKFGCPSRHALPSNTTLHFLHHRKRSSDMAGAEGLFCCSM